MVQASVSGYCRHLREQAAGRAARARLGQVQADLTETKAAQLRGELVEAAEVEAF
jgi:phage terminase Nu1 subunit (DNA packaging protein)